MSTKPASSVPTMAPMVLAAYSSPRRAPASSRVRTRYRVSSGRVIPMRNVAGATAASARAKRTPASWPGRSTRLGHTPRYSSASPLKANGSRAAMAATASSTSPYRRSGRRLVSASRPPARLPKPRPAMNAVTIVATAWVVLPNTSTSSRDHTTW